MTLAIRPLDPSRLADWLAFFDGRAFADNPDWGTCYCRCFLFGGDVAAWDRACATPGENRAVMARAVGAGAVDGLLAYEGDRVVGWVHFGPTGRFEVPSGRLAPDEEGVASIVCFLVAPEARRRGVARALLREACDELARRGFRAVDARPATAAEEGAMHQFRGPLALYLAEGFAVASRSDRTCRVRRALHATG